MVVCGIHTVQVSLRTISSTLRNGKEDEGIPRRGKQSVLLNFFFGGQESQGCLEWASVQRRVGYHSFLHVLTYDSY